MCIYLVHESIFLTIFFTKLKWENIIAAILAIVVGVLFIILPKDSADVLCLIAGILLIFAGSFTLVAYIFSGFFLGAHLLIVGIMLILLGTFCLANPENIMEVLTVLFGLYIVIDGTTSIVDSVYCAKAKIKGWGLLLVLAILSIGLGTAVMFSTFDTIMIFAGCSLIIDGVCDIIETIVFSHKIKEAKKKLLEGSKIIDIE